MPPEVSLDGIYRPSDDIVAREIEGELILIPMVAGIGDLEDELLTLNQTGRSIWGRLDGTRSLREIVRELGGEFEQTAGEIERDVLGFVGELLNRKLLFEVAGS